MDEATMTGQGSAAATRIGRYRLHEELASGGMATVYRATEEENEHIRRSVALKRIRPELAKDSTYAEMFFDEARIASRINHPHVCAVFDFGFDAGEAYLVMELLRGKTLRDVTRALASQPWAPEWPLRAAHLLGQAAEGLHAAHSLRDAADEPLRVIHRDVSPHNLFLTEQGQLKVIDFGVARATGNLHHTSPGIVKGKLAYLAPEQLGPEGYDHRVDIWALGVTLWEVLTGRTLFGRDRAIDTITAIGSMELVPPSSVHARIPRDLDAVVMRCLARDPDARYATARELSRALRRVCRDHAEDFDNVEQAEWLHDLFTASDARAAERTEARTIPPPRQRRSTEPGFGWSGRPDALAWELLISD